MPKSTEQERGRVQCRPRPPYATELHLYPLGTMPLLPSSLPGWTGERWGKHLVATWFGPVTRQTPICFNLRRIQIRMSYNTHSLHGDVRPEKSDLLPRPHSPGRGGAEIQTLARALSHRSPPQLSWGWGPGGKEREKGEKAGKKLQRVSSAPAAASGFPRVHRNLRTSSPALHGWRTKEAEDQKQLQCSPGCSPGQWAQAGPLGVRSKVLWVPHPRYVLSAARDQDRMGGIADSLHPPTAPPDSWARANRDKAWTETPPPKDKGNNPNCWVDKIWHTQGSPGPRKLRKLQNA